MQIGSDWLPTYPTGYGKFSLRKDEQNEKDSSPLKTSKVKIVVMGTAVFWD